MPGDDLQAPDVDVEDGAGVGNVATAAPASDEEMDNRELYTDQLWRQGRQATMDARVRCSV